MNEKDREMLEDSKLSIIETLNNSGFDVQKYFKDAAEYNVYNTGLTVKDTLGDINTDDYQFIADTIMPVMTIGDYNSASCTSTGHILSRSFESESFIESAAESTLIVIKSMIHITVVENTVVLILLQNCLNTKLLTPL